MPRGSGNTIENLKRRERNGQAFAVLDDMYISGDSIKPLHLAEWEEVTDSGNRLRLVRGERAVKQAPQDAVRYVEKTFMFPTGIVHELKFQESNGGIFRALTSETLIYMLKGCGSVDVNGETVDLQEGDAVIDATGTLRGSGDATVLAWTVMHPKHDDIATGRQGRVARKSEKRVTESAQWDVNGERYVANTKEDRARAPDDAIRLKIEVLDFERNVVGVVTGYKGGPTYEAASENDNYLYITSGSYRYFQDDVEFEARPGDVIREIAGHYHHWIRHEDSSFIVTSSLPVIPNNM